MLKLHGVYYLESKGYFQVIKINDANGLLRYCLTFPPKEGSKYSTMIWHWPKSQYSYIDESKAIRQNAEQINDIIMKTGWKIPYFE